MKTRLKSFLGLITSVLCISTSAQSTGFTYQGRLADRGQPANGTYDIKFSLYDEAVEGNVVGEERTNTALAVSNGLFSVTLDFDASGFDGSGRWLEIAVRTNSASDFTSLSPRTEITSTPYALRALNVASESITGTFGKSVAFTNQANTFVGIFAGDGANLTGLAASGLTGTASVDTTGNAGGATNIYAGGEVDTSTVRAKTSSATLTNAKAFLGYGGLQLSTIVYGQPPSGTSNQRPGLEFMPNGWDGTPLSDTDMSTVPMAAVKNYFGWGGIAAHSENTLHIQSRGNIRLEPGFANFDANAQDYISIGNEDGHTRVRVNFMHKSTHTTPTSNVEKSDASGWGLPLQFEAKGRAGDASYFAAPTIQGWFAGTDNCSPLDNVTLGELRFLSRPPWQDLNSLTFGLEHPEYEVEAMRMRTNGLHIFGPLDLGQSTPATDSSTNVVLDFNAASAQTIALSFATITNRIVTTNLNIYGGRTNMQTRTFRILSGALDRRLRWPNWSVVSEGGLATLPNFLPAQRVMHLRLEAWGSGDTNVIARYAIGADTSFSYDPNASTFFTAAGINDTTQKGAVDYLVTALKTAGLWNKITGLYPFVGGSGASHSYNLVNPAQYQISWKGSVTHNANGITGDGLTGYGATGYVHNYAGAETNAHLLIYCRTPVPADLGRFIAARNHTTGARMGLVRSGVSLAADGPMNLNSPSPLRNVNADFRGVLGVSRVTDGYIYHAIDRAGTASFSGAAVGVISVGYDILAMNWGDGNHYNQSNANLALVSIGFGMTAGELLAYRTIIDNYERLLGRQVP
jgi:hypothetical protein